MKTNYRVRIVRDEFAENPRKWSDSVSKLITISTRRNGWDLGNGTTDDCAESEGEALAVIMSDAGIEYADEMTPLHPITDAMKAYCNENNTGAYAYALNWYDFIVRLVDGVPAAIDEAKARIDKADVTYTERALGRDGIDVIAYMTKAMTKAVGIRAETTQRVIDEELAELSTYVDGDVYGFIIEEERDGCGGWEQVDGCWGFYGYEFAESEGQIMLVWHEKENA
jgi:hypothetical protein